MGDLLADLSDLGANLHILTWLVTLIGLPQHWKSESFRAKRHEIL